MGFIIMILVIYTWKQWCRDENSLGQEYDNEWMFIRRKAYVTDIFIEKWRIESLKHNNNTCKHHHRVDFCIPRHWLLMEKKIIGIDCDEVLCLLMKDFIPYMNERFDLNLEYEDLKEYDLNKYFHLNEEKVRLSIIVIDYSIGRVF